MFRIAAGWAGRLLPQLSPKTNKRLKAQLHRSRATAYNALQSAGVLLAGIPIVVIIAGGSAPLPSLDWLGHPITSALENPAPTPSENKPTKAIECSFPQTETTLFAVCAAFSADFGTEENSDVDQNMFNVSSGQPVVNREAQLYTNDTKNLRVENGALLLQALNDPQQGYRYTSARVDTRGKADFLYGKLIVRAKLPTGIGTWPAIWLLPSESKYANIGMNSTVARHLVDGEIDMAETVGSEPHRIYGVVHTLNYQRKGVDRTYFNTTKVPDSNTVFHDYTLEWTPTSITLSIDGAPFFTYAKKPGADYRSWPFDQPFYLVMNLALGGTTAGKDRRFPDGVDKTSLPATMEIQTIRYYPYIGQK